MKKAQSLTQAQADSVPLKTDNSFIPSVWVDKSAHQKWMITIQKINMVLLILGCFFLLGMTIKFYRPLADDTLNRGKGLPRSSETPITEKTPIISQPFDSYERIFTKRSLFSAVSKEDLSTVQSPNQSAAASLPDLKTKYRLVGIFIGANPEIVLEDLGKKETVFLSVGDNLDGMILDKIESEWVEFRHGDQIRKLAIE